MQCFECFYYFNGRFPLTNDLLPVPDRETSLGTEKISIKRLYKLYKGTKSHGLVSPQFLSALNLFFGGNIQLSKDTITELYENLTIETLSGKRQPKFDKILDIISDMKFTMQRSIMSTVKSNEKIKQKYNFVEQKNDHEKVEAEIVSDIIKDVPYEHIKTDQEYVQQTADDVQTIEYQTTKENNGFINTAIEFNKVNISAANQKKTQFLF